ncbi:MAG: hypothetical protein AB9873_14990 [Syntrophobacteraceae bacterium]
MRTIMRKLGAIGIVLALVMAVSTTDADARRYHQRHHRHHFNPLFLPFAVAGAVVGTAAAITTGVLAPRYPAYYGPEPGYCGPVACGPGSVWVPGHYTPYGEWIPGHWR